MNAPQCKITRSEVSVAILRTLDELTPNWTADASDTTKRYVTYEHVLQARYALQQLANAPYEEREQTRARLGGFPHIFLNTLTEQLARQGSYCEKFIAATKNHLRLPFDKHAPHDWATLPKRSHEAHSAASQIAISPQLSPSLTTLEDRIVKAIVHAAPRNAEQPYHVNFLVDDSGSTRSAAGVIHSAITRAVNQLALQGKSVASISLGSYVRHGPMKESKNRQLIVHPTQGRTLEFSHEAEPRSQPWMQTVYPQGNAHWRQQFHEAQLQLRFLSGVAALEQATAMAKQRTEQHPADAHQFIVITDSAAYLSKVRRGVRSYGETHCAKAHEDLIALRSEAEINVFDTSALHLPSRDEIERGVFFGVILKSLSDRQALKTYFMMYAQYKDLVGKKPTREEILAAMAQDPYPQIRINAIKEHRKSTKNLIAALSPFLADHDATVAETAIREINTHRAAAASFYEAVVQQGKGFGPHFGPTQAAYQFVRLMAETGTTGYARVAALAATHPILVRLPAVAPFAHEFGPAGLNILKAQLGDTGPRRMAITHLGDFGRAALPLVRDLLPNLAGDEIIAYAITLQKLGRDAVFLLPYFFERYGNTTAMANDTISALIASAAQHGIRGQRALTITLEDNTLPRYRYHLLANATKAGFDPSLYVTQFAQTWSRRDWDIDHAPPVEQSLGIAHALGAFAGRTPAQDKLLQRLAADHPNDQVRCAAHAAFMQNPQTGPNYAANIRLQSTAEAQCTLRSAIASEDHATLGALIPNLNRFDDGARVALLDTAVESLQPGHRMTWLFHKTFRAPPDSLLRENTPRELFDIGACRAIMDGMQRIR